MLDSVHRVPEKTETNAQWRKDITKKEEERMHTPIKYNQEASLNFVFRERRSGGILAYL